MDKMTIRGLAIYSPTGKLERVIDCGDDGKFPAFDMTKGGMIVAVAEDGTMTQPVTVTWDGPTAVSGH